MTEASAGPRAQRADGQPLDPRDGVIPIMKELEPGVLQIVGTACWITRYGLFLTAQHVLATTKSDVTTYAYLENAALDFRDNDAMPTVVSDYSAGLFLRHVTVSENPWIPYSHFETSIEVRSGASGGSFADSGAGPLAIGPVNHVLSTSTGKAALRGPGGQVTAL